MTTGLWQPPAEGARARGRTHVFIATAVTVVSVAPVFMVGTQAVDIERDLGMTVADLGLAVAVYSGATALSTALLGRVVQRLGVHRGLVGTMTAATVAFAGIALARTPAMLDIALALSGTINGAVHPSANGLLAASRATGPARAFGIKQASATGAGLLSGLVVPLVALTVGWRWSFVAMCVPSATLALLSRVLVDGQPVPVPSLRPRVASQDARMPIGLLALAGSFGAAAGNAFAAFFVVSGVHAGHVPQSTAALVFSLASLCGGVGRVASGRVIDRRGFSATVLAGCLLACGSLGDVVLASNPLGGVASLLVGGVVAAGIGWAWPGLLHYCVAVRDPLRAARSTGMMMTGFATGACFGPLLLGQLVGVVGYDDVWWIVALLNLCAAATLFAGTRGGRSAAVTGA